MNKYKAFCILLIVAIVIMAYCWNNSEQNRLKLLDELNEAKTTIEELRRGND